MEARFARTALFAAAGLLIWAADFLFLYVFAALACERGFGRLVPYASTLATLLAAGATIAVIRAGVRTAGVGTKGFVDALAASAAALALIAIAFIALPGLLLPRAC